MRSCSRFMSFLRNSATGFQAEEPRARRTVFRFWRQPQHDESAYRSHLRSPTVLLVRVGHLCSTSSAKTWQVEVGSGWGTDVDQNAKAGSDQALTIQIRIPQPASNSLPGKSSNLHRRPGTFAQTLHFQAFSCCGNSKGRQPESAGICRQYPTLEVLMRVSRR